MHEQDINIVNSTTFSYRKIGWSQNIYDVNTVNKCANFAVR
jgi:hypothetical protein